jgi:hypothetical protein
MFIYLMVIGGNNAPTLNEMARLFKLSGINVEVKVAVDFAKSIENNVKSISTQITETIGR